MTQIKILVNNINDVTHRAAAEAELNVYLKIGWKLHGTHQHLDDAQFLILTSVLTKEGEENEKRESAKQQTIQDKEDKNPVLKTDQKNMADQSEDGEERTTGDSESEDNKDALTKSTEKAETKRKNQNLQKALRLKKRKKIHEPLTKKKHRQKLPRPKRKKRQ